MSRGGTLFVVATPIGNLDDLSRRGSEVFAMITVCYAEDTRRTGRLLSHIGAPASLRSLHRHNEQARVKEAISRLDAGERIALVSDAGTPAISDPGRRLVAAALEAGHAVIPIPGPSAVPTALSASGMPADRFLFAGFPPRKGQARNEWLEAAVSSPHTVVAFEAPGRLSRLLDDLGLRGAGEREMVVCRELTKMHEEIRRGAIRELATVYREETVKGEVTLVMEGAPAAGQGMNPDIREVVKACVKKMESEGRTRREISETLRDRFGLARNEAYRASLESGDTPCE